MIELRKGDLFDAGTDAIVNTVNCKGVMGKGIALEFKKRFPAMFKEYAKLCKKNYIKIGEVWLWHDYIPCKNCDGQGNIEQPATSWHTATTHECPKCKGHQGEQEVFIFNFPTKDDWHNGSKLEWIASGLDDLKERVIMMSGVIKSIAFPALGCSNGGLRFEDVRPLIEEKLNDLHIPVILYEPQ